MTAHNTLVIRQATREDIAEIVALAHTVYGEVGYTPEHIQSHLRYFPEGKFVAVYDQHVVGYCATFMIKGEAALKAHTYSEISGHAFCSRHDPQGDYLYGMEVMVAPDYRNWRIGQRFYDARKHLCQQYKLRGIIFAGRMPNYHKHSKKGMTPEAYLEAVKSKKLRDPVINFQLRNHFEPLGILSNYLPHDHESGGNAVHMVWRNPLATDETIPEPSQRGRQPDAVRVAAVQFQARKVTSEAHFQQHMEYFVDIAADYKADFVLFPEMVTLCLLSAQDSRLNPEQSVASISDYTPRYIAFMRELAISYNINIIGGSHPTRMADGSIQNICYIFLRDGTVHEQPKIHPTPNEKYWWNIDGGNTLKAIDTDCGTIGVLICYDTEFPETARYLADQGATLLFVPYCTDERQGHLRVRYCAQARAVENQMYVITAGMVGNLPDVENMDIHYAESAIFTPCDFPFARDGIAAVAAENTEMIIFSDLRLDNLVMSRASGTVQNLKDRRFDLYRVEWKRKG